MSVPRHMVWEALSLMTLAAEWLLGMPSGVRITALSTLTSLLGVPGHVASHWGRSGPFQGHGPCPRGFLPPMFE